MVLDAMPLFWGRNDQSIETGVLLALFEEVAELRLAALGHRGGQWYRCSTCTVHKIVLSSSVCSGDFYTFAALA